MSLGAEGAPAKQRGQGHKAAGPISVQRVISFEAPGQCFKEVNAEGLLAPFLRHPSSQGMNCRGYYSGGGGVLYAAFTSTLCILYKCDG